MAFHLPLFIIELRAEGEGEAKEVQEVKLSQ
jgi:hypothetical protein